jgi:uncharacterized repeat protein (TIGR03843 family)
MAELPTNPWSAADPAILDTLRESEIGELQLVYDSSNYVFVARLSHPERGEGLGVYKPAAGAQPLSDFAYTTLHQREIAAFELSTLLGWGIVPPVVEHDGPHGLGSLQLFVTHDPNEHYFNLRADQQYRSQFMRVAAFDLIANNADRKAGHLLRDAESHVWCIDNALCFHRAQKMRTVVWDFAGETLEDAWVEDIRRVRRCIEAGDPATAAFRSLLREPEVEAFLERCDALTGYPVLPEMYPWRCVPWPLI